MDVPTWVWIATGVVTVAIFTFDLVIVGRRPHEPSMKECATYLSIYVGLAILFGIGVWVTWDHQHGLEFFSGWLVEYSLSIDNLFIFIIIMAKFAVPQGAPAVRPDDRHRDGAGHARDLHRRRRRRDQQLQLDLLPLRPLPGLHGLQAGQGGRRGRGRGVRGEPLVAFIEKRFPATSEWHGRKLFVSGEGAKQMITPMFIVIITLGTTDLLFALDSIPAIFGITKEPYLVLTANIFALMGLRQLYFLIGGLLQRLIYLSYGLAFLLAFIGVKLFFHALHENELPFINGGEHLDYAWLEIPIWLSLVVIVATLAVTAALSLYVSSRMSPEEQDAPPVRAATGKTTDSAARRGRVGRRRAASGPTHVGSHAARGVVGPAGHPQVEADRVVGAQQELLLGGAAVVVGVVAVVAERVAGLERDRRVPLEQHARAAYAVR